MADGIEDFPTQVDCMENNKRFPNLRVFWSKNKNESSSDWAIHEKIKAAFCNVSLSPLNGLIQFWAPVEKGGRRRLTTRDQPFAFDSSGSKKYRLSCMKYDYSIDQDYKVEVEVEVEVEEESMIISGAPAANAFVDHFPKFVSNVNVREGNPLVRSALECELTTCLLTPVFDPCQKCFVGVVECSTNRPSLVTTFSALRSALEKAGLATVDGYQPQKAIPRIANEIKVALKVACKTHDLTFAKAWSGYGNSAFDSCLGVKQIRDIKCVDFHKNVGLDHNVVSDACLKVGWALVLRTLSSRKPHLARNIKTHRSCLVVHLRTIATNDVVFAFQFLWPQTRDYIILMDSLFLTLKRSLPSFIFDDELRVVDVTPTGPRAQNAVPEEQSANGNGNGNLLLLHLRYIKQRKRNSEESQTVNSNTEMNQQQRNVSSSTLKRKRDSESQTVNSKVMNLPVKVKYGHQMFKLYVSPTLGAVRKALNETYGLMNCSSYILEYLDEEKEWIVLGVEDDFTHCIRSWRIQDTNYIQLRVVPSG